MISDGMLGLGSGQRVAIFINRQDRGNLLAALGLDPAQLESPLAGSSDDWHVQRGAAMMVHGVRVWLSDFVPEGQVILCDPTGRPIPVAVGNWADVARTITALALAGVDEKVGP